MKEMEKAVMDFKNGTCTERDALNVIMTVIFKNKSYFGLDKLDEDNFSDYLLYLEERLPRFLVLYDPSISRFSTYLRKLCMTQLRSWYRRFYHNYARDVALTTYALEESMTSFSLEDDPEALYGEMENNGSRKMKRFLDQTNKKIPMQTKIMMLALKSASFLTPRHIRKICKMADITEEELYEKLDRINNALDDKLKRQKHLIHLQNEAYIIRKESDIQMSILNPESSHYRNAKVSREYHDKLWKSRIERSRSTHDVYPTNSLVSEVLDIPLGQVTHVLSAVHHKMDGSNGEKEVSYEYDDLRSNRKPSQAEGTSGNTVTTRDTDSKR